MGATARRSTAAPSDLQAKRSANLSAVDDEMSDAERMQAEVDAEEEVDEDGSILVHLVTDRGEAGIRVPPVGRWRSQARAALFSRGDDLTWAALTLSPDDARTWQQLDPTKDDSDEFFTLWGNLTGQAAGESRASRRASGRTRGR